MRKIYALSLCIVVVAVIGWLSFSSHREALDTAQIKFIDTGWVADSRTGDGVYMTFQAKTLPPDGIKGFEPSIVSICNQFVESVVPFVSEKTGRKDPPNIVITIKHGGFVGTYGKLVLPYRAGKCSE